MIGRLEKRILDLNSDILDELDDDYEALIESGDDHDELIENEDNLSVQEKKLLRLRLLSSKNLER